MIKLRANTPNKQQRDDLGSRFYQHVDCDNPVDLMRSNMCVMWGGCTDHAGYGCIWSKGKEFRAHRIAFIMVGNKLRSNQFIDHVCNNKACVNPRHLRILSHRENTLRGTNVTAVNAKKTHCIHGHELFGKNLSKTNGRNKNYRICKTCKLRKQRKYYGIRMKKLGRTYNPYIKDMAEKIDD